MKVHVVPTPPGDIVSLSERNAIQAIDLWGNPAYRVLWRSRTRSDPEGGGSHGLPSAGYGSPMGYWLSAAGDPPVAGQGGLTIVFAAPGDESLPPPASLAQAPDGTRSRPLQTVRIKNPTAGEGDVMLTIGAGGARVVATPAAWKTLAEPVLLAVAQYWRFSALDAELARLTELAHGDLPHATMPGPSTLKASAKLTENARAARALLLDLPHFEGPLTDP